MDLIIINCINDTDYAHELRIQNIQPRRILYIMQQIIGQTKKVYTNLTPNKIVNNIIANAYNSYIDIYNDPFYKDYKPTSINLTINWYISSTDGINRQQSTITGLEQLLQHTSTVKPFDIIVTEFTTDSNSDIQICPINYNLRNVPISLFSKVYRDFIKVGTYIYRDTIRGSYITVLYDKTNHIIYFDKKTEYIDDLDE